MNWYYANAGDLPKDGESVLILANDTYIVATYNKKKNIFIPRKNPSVIFNTLQQPIYWTPLTAAVTTSNY